ncbi:uncharacterized protein G6M90_00g091530 [Metarhizium brunneum]|uniref:Uncharacterized protein n=1 Tax=Metarhizium brunneum TaxID=500148 RepID=A0A7D5Z4T4_9HYPO|nr:hypothetical protein G6M90_00g091530 [Metarhizium brunneum]
MRLTNVVVLGAALPPLASAANFVRGNRVSFNTFKYDIDKCTDEKPCSLYLPKSAPHAGLQIRPRVTDCLERAFSLINGGTIENQAGTEFIARIQNVPSGTYIFQATGGEDGKTAITTQFTYNTNLATIGTGTGTVTPPSPTTSSPGTSLETTSSPPGPTAASSDSGSTGTSAGPVTGSLTGTSTAGRTGTAIISSTGSLTGSSRSLKSSGGNAGNGGAVVDENCNGAIDNNDCAELGGSCYF